MKAERQQVPSCPAAEHLRGCVNLGSDLRTRCCDPSSRWVGGSEPDGGPACVHATARRRRQRGGCALRQFPTTFLPTSSPMHASHPEKRLAVLSGCARVRRNVLQIGWAGHHTRAGYEMHWCAIRVRSLSKTPRSRARVKKREQGTRRRKTGQGQTREYRPTQMNGWQKWDSRRGEGTHL